MDNLSSNRSHGGQSELLREETAQQKFAEAPAEARDKLIRMSLRGESTNAPLAKTILHLLRRKGSMATKDLHSHSRRIHSDLREDSVDRVVQGGRTMENDGSIGFERPKVPRRSVGV